jgi:hypothetical protein
MAKLSLTWSYMYYNTGYCCALHRETITVRTVAAPTLPVRDGDADKGVIAQSPPFGYHLIKFILS